MKPSASCRPGRRFAGSTALALAVAAVLAVPATARACPFCSAVSLTFAQEIAQSDAAVIARLVEPPTPGSLSPRADGPLPRGRFAIVEVLKGGDLLAGQGLGPADGEIETILLEEKPAGTLYLLMGVEPPRLVWSSPIRVSDRAVDYLRKLADLPEKGPDRLAFFMQHLEDEDDSLARDAYDEFAISPYADVRGLENRMDSTQLLAWIENPKVQANRRRLYATMLGVCGTRADAARIGRLLAEEDLTPDEAEARSGLDALIACYVTLEGPAGLDLVDRLFLRRRDRDQDIPFAETYAAVMALRFLGEESDAVPRQRVLASLRLLLDEPKLADLVIADLARWEDWSVIDRLVTLFEKAESDNIFVREPVVNYLRSCPLPEAAAAITKLEAIDPDAVRRAATLAGLAALASPAGPRNPGDGQPGDGQPGDGQPEERGDVPPTAADLELARRITPVIGEDPAGLTRGDGDVPSAGRPADGSRAVPVPPPSGSTPAAGGPEPQAAWKWALWAAAIVLVAFVSRAFLKPSAAAGPQR
jgi:hypothetical protein